MKWPKHSSELFADHAVEFLASSKKSKTPFFMYVSFNAPHDPRQSPKPFVERYPVTKTKIPKNYLPEHPFDNGAITIRDEQLAPFPRTKNAIRTHRAEYYAMISHMDEQIGRILNALEKSGQADDTYIIFTSDHGLGRWKSRTDGKTKSLRPQHSHAFSDKWAWCS
jgi:choline-sulfatase